MKMTVNGLQIGWKGITPPELEEQCRIARLDEMPLGRCRDLRRGKPYGRLVPLYRVVPDKTYASKQPRWLCRCTCLKGTLTVVLAQNLVKRLEPTVGCGCVQRIRASENPALLKKDPDFRKRQAAAAGANMRRYIQEHAEEVRARSRLNGISVFNDPKIKKERNKRVQNRRISRGYDPETPISTHYVLIRHAIRPLTKYIMCTRDDYTCALCNRRGGTRFEVHHVIPVEQDWLRVGDPSNLISLCHGCHLKGAHDGCWKKVDTSIQKILLRSAADREGIQCAPSIIVDLVQKRLLILGRQLGRI